MLKIYIHKKLSEVLLVLFSNVDMSHIPLIERYILSETPALLATKELRAEAVSVFAAINRLETLGENAPYARMIYSHTDIPEIQRGKMRLVAAWAQELARRDFPSFKQYANISNESFQSLIGELKNIHEKAADVLPPRFLPLLEEGYGTQQLPLALAAV